MCMCMCRLSPPKWLVDVELAVRAPGREDVLHVVRGVRSQQPTRHAFVTLVAESSVPLPCACACTCACAYAMCMCMYMCMCMCHVHVHVPCAYACACAWRPRRAVAVSGVVSKNAHQSPLGSQHQAISTK